MPTVNDHRFDRESKRFALHNALIRGITVAQGETMTGWPPNVVRQTFYGIAKDVHRKLVKDDYGTFRLGSMLKAVKDSDARHGRGR